MKKEKIDIDQLLEETKQLSEEHTAVKYVAVEIDLLLKSSGEDSNK